MTSTYDNDLPELDFGNEQFNFAAKHILHVKAETVINHDGDGAPDLMPACAVIRNDEFLCWTIANQVHRDVALNMTWQAIAGFQAEAIVLGLDARTTVQPWSKEQMDAIKSGDLQKMAEEQASDLLGITVEAIVINIVTNEGHATMGVFPYVVHKSDDGKTHNIEWLDQTDIFSNREDEAHVEGVVPETLREAFQRAKEIPDLAALGSEALGLSRLQARVHTDCAIIRLLSDAGFAVMYNADTDEKRAILAASQESGVLAGMTAVDADQLDQDN